MAELFLFAVLLAGMVGAQGLFMSGLLKDF
jgi:hypothetical protein